MHLTEITHIATPVLDIACEQSGPADGFPVVLLHGFPYDPRAFDQVVASLNRAGHRTIVPYLRGYGATRFLSPDTLRSGQQAALAQDLLDLLDALGIERAVLAGFDWGGRAACIAAALWPERVAGLVSCGGYNLQNLVMADRPADPEQELRYWYQYYFNTERGRNGLTDNRHAFCKLLWTMWSPGWAFDDATYDRTAASFENNDFVDVVIHSYRHRLNNAPGDPRYDAIETHLVAQPTISVPTIVIHGAKDGVTPAELSEPHYRKFGPRYERQVWPDAGHNPPQERPTDFAAAILELCAASRN